MKIGILAFQQSINYGAALQIYALQTVISQLVSKNTDVEVINYIQPELSKKYKTIRFNNNLLKDSLANILFYRQRSLSSKKFTKFYKKYINLTEEVYSLQDISTFQTIVVGSDQVWNSSIHDYDSTYLLNTDQNINKISYAASIGKSKLTEKDQEYFRKFLPSFSSVAVRESSGVDLLSKYTDERIEVTLDPTLLLPVSHWKKLRKAPRNREKYILVYQLQNNSELDALAKKVSVELNLPLKYIKPQNNLSLHRFSTEYSYGPEEFLGLFNDSEFVITNSFHGTCFSVIFNKRFLTVPHKSRGARMIDFLNNLGLEDRLIYEAKELNDRKSLLKNQDFTDANEKLNNLQLHSINYLKNSLINHI